MCIFYFWCTKCNSKWLLERLHGLRFGVTAKRNWLKVKWPRGERGGVLWRLVPLLSLLSFFSLLALRAILAYNSWSHAGYWFQSPIQNKWSGDDEFYYRFVAVSREQRTEKKPFRQTSGINSIYWNDHQLVKVSCKSEGWNNSHGDSRGDFIIAWNK